MDGSNLEPRVGIRLIDPHHVVQRQQEEIGEILVLQEGTELLATNYWTRGAGGNDWGHCDWIGIRKEV